MEQVTDKRIGTTSTIRAFRNTELELRISDKQTQGYELVDQGYEGERMDGSRWWAKLRYVGVQPDNGRIQAGDTVYHKPSEESWFVLGVNYTVGRLCVAGWPHTVADIADCDLTERGNGISDEYLAARTRMFGTGWDE